MRTCTECASEFHGRADAKYCSPACRQRAHRDRNRPHTYTPQPIDCKTSTGLPLASPQRLRTALNLTRYDAHDSADALRPELDTAAEWADWIDDTIEWLSVVRDGLRGMDKFERIQASVIRCAPSRRR
jgi:hypothetical protein